MARSAVLLKPVLLLGCHVLHSWPHDRLKHLQVRLGVHWTLEPVHWEEPAIDYANLRHHLFTVSVLARYDLVGVGRTPDDFVFPVRRRRQTTTSHPTRAPSRTSLLHAAARTCRPEASMLGARMSGLEPDGGGMVSNEDFGEGFSRPFR